MDDVKKDHFDALTVAMSRVITPVAVCIALTVWLVKSLGDPSACAVQAAAGVSASVPFLGVFPVPSAPLRGGDGGRLRASQAWLFVGVFCALVVLCTFLLVCLFRAGQGFVIASWLFLSAAVVFAFVGGVYLFEFCRSRCIALDWMTLSFATWNFAVTGLVAVFLPVPRVVNQAFLVALCALMAFIFRSLRDWATWTVLALLVAWDLFAVLAPCGPLRALVDAARERAEPLPALVYDTDPRDAAHGPAVRPALFFVRDRAARPDPDPACTPADSTPDSGAAAGRSPAPDDAALAAAEVGDRRAKRRARRARHRPDPAAADAGAEGNGEHRRWREEQRRGGNFGAHMKLGLGDFVFYSVLVAEASKQGTMNALICFVAVMSGLCATLFLVLVHKKPLPALPISILTGMLFYVLTRYTVKPFVLNLFPELLFH